MPASVELDHRNNNFSEYPNNEAGKSLASLERSVSGSHFNESRWSFSSDTFDPNLDSDLDVPEDDSPYPEVRSSVANFDDTAIPVSTLRAWLIGFVFSIILPGLNQLFHFRYPSVTVGSLVAQLVVFPIGRCWARFVPRKTIFGVSLNPGPFTIKEHVLITIMAGVGSQSAYAADIIAVQRVYYNQQFNFIYQWMLVMSTQLIGFSIGGITRRFLVVPPSMIWPNALVLCALFNTLHSQSYPGMGLRGGLSRERFFVYVFVGSAFWYLFPGYLFTALSMFSWVCWIAPKNVKINQLFGYQSGLGLSILTFDWAQISYTGSPLATPWWAEANVAIGFVFFFWFLTPVLYYSNAWYGQYMPISSRLSFDNVGNGSVYNLSRIINQNATLNMTEYKAYSPLFLSTTFIMSYALSFLSITATITHAIIYFWKPIKIHFLRSLQEQPDIHSRLMARYRQVPEWWYGCIFAATFTFACICIKAFPTEMTIWALIIALLLAIFYVVPIGMIQAVTNRQIGLNVITELIIGYMLPGRPVAMMMFKTWGYITMSQAMTFTADLKLGHYMKIPPRALFLAQILATVIAGTVQLGVQTWMFANIPDLCHSSQKDGFICPGTEVFGTASVVWGVIGPGLQFSTGQVYHVLLYFFLIGAACPVVLWLITKRYPHTILNYMNFPLIFYGTSLIPQAGANNYVPWLIIGFFFQYIIRRRHFSFWAKYNYVLSAALDAGTAVGVIFVYFCLQYPLNGTIGHAIKNWWGNTVYMQTADWQAPPLKFMPKGETFGPKTW